MTGPCPSRARRSTTARVRHRARPGAGTLLIVLLATALALPLSAIGCGEEEPQPEVKLATTTPSPAPTGMTRYAAEEWGLSLSYDPSRFALTSIESTSSIDLGPSLLTDGDLDLSGIETLEVQLELTADDVSRILAPSFLLTAQRLPFAVGENGAGLARLALDDALAELERAWSGLLSDEPQTTDVSGAATAIEVEAVGDDGVAAAELHTRVIVATLGRHLYTVRMTALRDSWDDVEPELRAVAQELRLEVDGDLAELSAGEAEYANDRYRFALDLPAGFPLVRHAEDPTPQLEFGAEFADLERSPLVAVSVGVARAPGGVGNSQSRVLQAFYREAVDELRAQPTVVAVRAPRTVELNGSSAWLVDVSRKRADGTVLRTRTYDVWRDDYVYSVVARGRASEWAGDWQVLSAIVESFEVG